MVDADDIMWGPVVNYLLSDRRLTDTDRMVQLACLANIDAVESDPNWPDIIARLVRVKPSEVIASMGKVQWDDDIEIAPPADAMPRPRLSLVAVGGAVVAPTQSTIWTGSVVQIKGAPLPRPLVVWMLTASADGVVASRPGYRPSVHRLRDLALVENSPWSNPHHPHAIAPEAIWEDRRGHQVRVVDLLCPPSRFNRSHRIPLLHVASARRSIMDLSAFLARFTLTLPCEATHAP